MVFTVLRLNKILEIRTEVRGVDGERFGRRFGLVVGRIVDFVLFFLRKYIFWNEKEYFEVVSFIFFVLVFSLVNWKL